jgi:two-component system OmpR family response regulator
LDLREKPAVALVSVRKTLVVEDDRVARLALTKILESLGQEVDTAATLAEGHEKLAGGIQCMLLDLVLPDGDGIEILRRVRAENRPIRVAVTTGISDPDLLVPIYALNPDAVFHKPLHLPDIARWLLRPE